MSPWERAGAMPMPGKNIDKLFEIGSVIVARACDGAIAGAPIHNYRGVDRLSLAGTLMDSTKKSVIIEPLISPGVVVSARLEVESGLMGRPLIGYDGHMASSYFGDKFSKDEGYKAIGASVYKEGYGLITFTREDDTNRIVNDLDPKDILSFLGVCLGVVRARG